MRHIDPRGPSEQHQGQMRTAPDTRRAIAKLARISFAMAINSASDLIGSLALTAVIGTIFAAAATNAKSSGILYAPAASRPAAWIFRPSVP
jgi:hypothetical protein